MFVGQEMPVSADDGGVTPLHQLRRDARHRWQTHGPGNRGNIALRGAEDLRQLHRRDDLPVPPDELVDAIGKIRADERRAGGALR